MAYTTFEALLGSSSDVAKYFDETPIIDGSTYIGKEHFWMLLADENVSQTQASRLYQAVTFPWLRITSPANCKALFPVRPSDLGIDVANRSEVGMQNPPFSLTALTRNTASFGVIPKHQRELRHADDEVSRVIRVGSFINFAAKLYGLGQIEGRPKNVRLRNVGPGGVPTAHLLADSLRLCIGEDESGIPSSH